MAAIVDAKIKELTMVSSVGPVGSSVVTAVVDSPIASVQGTAGHLPPPDADVYLLGAVHIGDVYGASTHVPFSFVEALGFVTSYSGLVSYSAQWQDNLSLEYQQDIRALVFAAWQDKVMVRDGSPSGVGVDVEKLADTGLVIEDLVNIKKQTSVVEDTGASTHYSDFPFESYASINGQTFAVKDGKVYRLGVCSGEKAPYVFVDFGQTDLSITQAKRVEAVYLGVDNDGTMYAKVSGDNKDRVYRVAEQRQIHRVRTAKGIAARTWGLALVSVAPESFDLSNVEFVVRVSTRRWVR